MGMYLMRQIGTRRRLRRPVLPDFMVFLDWKELPWHWALSAASSPRWCWSSPCRRCSPSCSAGSPSARASGVYLSIIIAGADGAYAAMLLFFRNEMGFGGNNGFTDFKRILGFPIATQEMRPVSCSPGRCWASSCWRAGWWAQVRPRAAAIPRRRAASCSPAIQPAAPSSASGSSAPSCAAWPGALYVPQVGIINPGEMGPANSIEIAIWAAVGGARLWSAHHRRLPGQRRQSWLTVAAPEYWLFFLGGLFIVVTLFLRNGVVGRCASCARQARDRPGGSGRRAIAGKRSRRGRANRLR